MVYGVYSVYDLKVGYGVPVTQENDAVAMRNFENGLADKSSIWYTHCSDFFLDRLGTFDTVTGELVAESPTRLISAADIINMRGDEFEI